MTGELRETETMNKTKQDERTRNINKIKCFHHQRENFFQSEGEIKMLLRQQLIKQQN